MQHSRTPNDRFKSLRWRLLLSSLGLMALTLAVAETAIYQYVRLNLIQKFDRELATLGDAAAHSLPDIAAHRVVEARRSLDNDGDLDIPWQNLQTQQGIEWFRPDGRRLALSGRNRIDVPLARKLHTQTEAGIRALTLPVYQDSSQKSPVNSLQRSPDSIRTKHSPELKGYVRVSASTATMAEELERLRWGLVWGGLMALLICGMGSAWLTQQALQPVEQSFQQLKQFTADASHELRSPLTAIRTATEVMQSHPERIHSADVQKLDLIASTTAQITQLVEDLLLLARADANAEAGWLPLPLDDLLEELADSLMLLTAASQIELKANLAPNTLIRGNSTQIKRLFTNLLENAIYYTLENGRVTLTSSVKDNWVIVTIEDTGIGIAPEQMPHLFERFWRADQARSRREGGSGLGLAIAASIVQAHRGTLSAQSQLGIGSRFQVELPLL